MRKHRRLHDAYRFPGFDPHPPSGTEGKKTACGACGTVKRESLDFLSDNPFYTKRFAFYVGRRCRASSIKDIAMELHLDWHAIKELEKQYMREQLRRIGTPGPKIIGIDEVSIRKGHTYRIVVSDLVPGSARSGSGVWTARKLPRTPSTSGWDPRRAKGMPCW